MGRADVHLSGYEEPLVVGVRETLNGWTVETTQQNPCSACNVKDLEKKTKMQCLQLCLFLIHVMNSIAMCAVVHTC